jgi:hypothetical protein
MKQFHYVYITTNLINGNQYIGDHSTNNLNDGYLGSGRPYFQHAIKKYGKSNFKREILEHFNNREEAFLAQEKYINQFNTLYPNGYNISPKGGNKFKGSVSEESKRKMSNSHKGVKREPHSEETKLKIKKGNEGKKISKETREKISNTLKNNIPWNKGLKNCFSEESKRKNSESHKGKKFSEEHIRKLRISLKGNQNAKRIFFT